MPYSNIVLFLVDPVNVQLIMHDDATLESTNPDSISLNAVFIDSHLDDTTKDMLYKLLKEHHKIGTVKINYKSDTPGVIDREYTLYSATVKEIAAIDSVLFLGQAVGAEEPLIQHQTLVRFYAKNIEVRPAVIAPRSDRHISSKPKSTMISTDSMEMDMTDAMKTADFGTTSTKINNKEATTSGKTTNQEQI